MKNILGRVLVLFALVAAAAPAAAETRVYLLAGQSNMAGVGTAASLPAPYNVPQDVNFWGNGRWVPLRGGFGYRPTQFGPEISFGHAIKQAYPDDDIYLVKYGASGTNLAAQWKPDGTGKCYNTFKSRVNAALENLRQAGRTPVIAGMLWMQGESDAHKATYAANYQANLKTLIKTARSDFAAPDMAFVLGRIAPFYDSDPAGGNAAVRLAQETTAGLLENIAWFDTDDLQQAYGGHYGTEGQIELGKRFAAKFTTGIRARDARVGHPCPRQAVSLCLGAETIFRFGDSQRQGACLRTP